MHCVYDLLADIERRPGMILGLTDDEWGKRLEYLGMFLVGYSGAVEMHRVDDPGGALLSSFGSFLAQRHGWSMCAGPIAAIRQHAPNDAEAWRMFWSLLKEFREGVSPPPSGTTTGTL